jgi:DNA gyrase subunit B
MSVADNGRGTDTRFDDHGQVVRKPVMATRDLRFFDQPDAQRLPDGHPRRGMSVVAALSDWLVHSNRRTNGAWSQRYEHGVPVTDLIPVPGDKTNGTTVRFQPDLAIRFADQVSAVEVARLCRGAWPHLTVEIRDERNT